MLPGHVAGHYPRDALEIDLVRLARFAGARLILGAASAIDRVARTITVGARRIAYDLASIDIGITSDLPDLIGFSATAFPPSRSAPTPPAGPPTSPATAPPPSPSSARASAGVELAMAMAHALRRRAAPPPITVLDRGTALPGTAPAAARRLRGPLRLGIDLSRTSTVSEHHRRVRPPRRRPRDPLDLHRRRRRRPPAPWLATPASTSTRASSPSTATSAPPTPRSTPAATPPTSPTRRAPRRASTPSARPHPLRQPPRSALRIAPQALRSAGRLPQARSPSAASPRWASATDHARGQLGLAPQGPHRPPLHGPPRRPARRCPRRRLPAEVARGLRAQSFTGRAALRRLRLQGRPAGPVHPSPRSRPPPRADVRSRPGDDAAILRMGRTTQVLTTDHLRAFTSIPGSWGASPRSTRWATSGRWARRRRPRSPRSSCPRSPPRFRRGPSRNSLTRLRNLHRRRRRDRRRPHHDRRRTDARLHRHRPCRPRPSPSPAPAPATR
jgi:selenide, water dikinase